MQDDICMDEMSKVTDKLEYLLLKDIINGLRDETISEEDAKTIAAVFLDLEPFASIDDAKNKMNTFIVTYPRFMLLKEYMDAYHEEQRTAAVIEKMKEHIKNDNLDQALQVAQNS